MESTVEYYSILDLLRWFGFGLNFPCFALFLIAAIIVEIACGLKRACGFCSLAMVSLTLLTGAVGLVFSYYGITASFLPGDRVFIPAWYYPLAAAIVLLLSVPFIMGARQLWKEGARLNTIIRCAMFCAALYFAFSAIRVPTQINQALERNEAVSDEAA